MRRQDFAGGTDIDIPVGIVAELILAEEAIAHRWAALRLGNIGCQASLLAGLDILDLEVAAIGDNVDLLNTQNLARRLGRLLSADPCRRLGW